MAAFAGDIEFPDVAACRGRSGGVEDLSFGGAGADVIADHGIDAVERAFSDEGLGAGRGGLLFGGLEH